jgi:hypothetical protein
MGSQAKKSEREISSTRQNSMLAKKVADTTSLAPGLPTSGSAKKEPAPAVHQDGARAVLAVWSGSVVCGRKRKWTVGWILPSWLDA